MVAEFETEHTSMVTLYIASVEEAYTVNDMAACNVTYSMHMLMGASCASELGQAAGYELVDAIVQVCRWIFWCDCKLSIILKVSLLSQLSHLECGANVGINIFCQHQINANCSGKVS